MKRMLALLCVLLLAVVAAEATQRSGANSHPIRRTATTHPLQPPVTTHLASAESLDQWMKVALARPLFAPDRKPVAGTVAADPGMPRLAGIIESPDAAVAIFQPADGVRPVVARHGEKVGGWEVTSIATGAVNLRRENDVVILSPRFDGARPDGTVKQDANNPKPRWEAPAPTGVLRARWSNPHLQP
jgi:hypothetical protein